MSDTRNPTNSKECSKSLCGSTCEEDTSEAFEDARSEPDKDQEYGLRQKKYENEQPIKLASPHFDTGIQRVDDLRPTNDPNEAIHRLRNRRRYSVVGCEPEFTSSHLELPPLETFFDGLGFNGLDLLLAC